MTDDTKKRFRWSRLILVLSLAMNIAVIGIVGGAALRWGGDRGPEPRVQMREFGFGPFVGALDKEDRRALGRVFVRTHGDPSAARKEVHATFEAILLVLQTEPFEADQFETLLLKQQDRFSKTQVTGTSLLAQALAEMSQEDRAAYTARLDEMLKRPPPPPHGGKAPDSQNTAPQKTAPQKTTPSASGN